MSILHRHPLAITLLLLLLGIGILSGVLPSMHAAAMNPVDALRSE